jgi:LuxR family maltose regulon positive regulatory protein
MSASVILQTKLTPPPVRVDRVHRPRLTERFSASLEHPLTLVCAPAGYGKSTLLAEWFGSEVGRAFVCGWLSLDEDDSDPVRFLMYLISAVANTSGIETNDLLSLLNSPLPPPPKDVLTVLISRLEDFPHHIALVLDDYHRISSQSIHDGMAYLLDHLPSQVRLVMTSREEPPLPLARLRGRRQLAEIRADDLRFTPEEAGQFLWQMLGTELSLLGCVATPILASSA